MKAPPQLHTSAGAPARKTPFASFKNGYLKTLDLDRYFRLSTSAAKRAYRYLDKNLPAAGPRAYDLQRFACQHVGFSSNYKPGRLRSEVQQTIVQPLEQEEFIEAMPARNRFVKRAGRYQVVFARAGQQVLPPPAGEAPPTPEAAPSPALAELKRHGVGGKAARDFVAAHPTDYLAEKIDFLDFLIEAGQAPKNPAGWLRSAIEEDYGPPAGYLPQDERAQRKAEEIDRRRRLDESRGQAEQAKRKEQVAAGRVPAAVAREIAQLGSEAEQRAMVARFFAEGLTSDAAAKAKVEKKTGGKPAVAATKKTFTLAPGTTVVFTSKKKHTNGEIAAALRQAAELLESDGRSRTRKAG